ncbi:MAG: hypothetical protein AABY89_02735 [Acidobacteriota bacterium]
MKPAELVALLQDLHRDKLAAFLRREAGARHVASYEFNNTYQYILNRDDEHLSWIRDALIDLGATADESVETPAVPSTGKGEARAMAIIEADARDARGFLARWRPRIEHISHARHRKMLELLIGESAEQLRFFEQALAGRLDLLGRRPDGAGTGGGVLSARWVN